MRTIETAIQINAPAARVWEVLTDFSRYPEWNPFILRVDGPLRPGERLKVRLRSLGSRTIVYRPRLLAADPERQVRWRGHMLLPGIFDREHWFRTAPNTRGCRFEQGKTFQGVFLKVLDEEIYEATERGFNEMNEALKAFVESGSY